MHCLYSDRDGALWVGFDGAGLGRLKGGKLTRFTDGKDSPLSFIYQIGLTKGGNLWLGLRSGLMQVNFKELNDYLDGRVSAVTRRTYTAGDGLSSSNFGFPYGSRRLDPSDSVWMSSLRNIVQLSDTPLEVNRVPPRINFNGLVLDDKSVSVTNGVATFHSKIQTIRVNFDVPSFQDHSALTVEYQLEGLTNDWHRLSSSSFVNFTKLIPGDYVFRLRAANNDGVMSEPKELVRFKVLPAFHQTWWFFGLLFLAVVGLVVIVIRWRTGALLSRNRELEDGVKSRTKELEWATRQAEAAVHAKSEFLAVMSHEIRTPMNGVMGTLELLSMTELSREQREHVATVRSSSDLLLSLLNDVLDLSKLEVHRMELENVPFSLEQIVEEVAKPMRITAQLKGIDFLMQYSSGIPRVFSGDPIRLRQVLFNLCSNAVKFTETGTVKIIVHGSLQPSELWEIRIGVEDTGIGIEQDRLGVLFENFSQVDSSFARRFGGSGLGLAISKKLVGLMNGSFEVISEIGKGSQFWCVVPLVAADPSLVAKPVKNIFAGELPQFGVRVLLAEDNAVNQTVARRQLEKLGCFVDIANNGRQALEKYKANDYEIIFMDCQMPEMDGFEATARIRALPAKGEKPVIIALTANSMSGDRDRCIAAGMNDYLSKPYEFEALIAILTRHLKSASISMRQQ